MHDRDRSTVVWSAPVKDRAKAPAIRDDSAIHPNDSAVNFPSVIIVVKSSCRFIDLTTSTAQNATARTFQVDG